jgi:hypothetical protein
MQQLRTEFLCTLTARIASPREIGETPRGNRRFFAVIGGTVEGPRLRGEVLPDGGDWLLIRPDGVLELDVRGTMRTDDGALIYIRNTGLRRATPEVGARLARGEPVDPAEYYYRVAPVFDTAAPRYAWLNSILAVGVGERLPDGVRYSIFEIL